MFSNRDHMFLGTPFDNPDTLQRIILVLNTLVLICALLAFEFLNVGAAKRRRKQARLFYPIAIVLTGMLVYAMYQQGTA